MPRCASGLTPVSDRVCPYVCAATGYSNGGIFQFALAQHQRTRALLDVTPRLHTVDPLSPLLAHWGEAAHGLSGGGLGPPQQPSPARAPEAAAKAASRALVDSPPLDGGGQCARCVYSRCTRSRRARRMRASTHRPASRSRMAASPCRAQPSSASTVRAQLPPLPSHASPLSPCPSPHGRLAQGRLRWHHTPTPQRWYCRSLPLSHPSRPSAKRPTTFVCRSGDALGPSARPGLRHTHPRIVPLRKSVCVCVSRPRGHDDPATGQPRGGRPPWRSRRLARHVLSRMAQLLC